MSPQVGFLDTLWVGPASLALLGIPIQHIILVLAALFGLIRVIHAGFDLYHKIKEKRNVKGD